MKVIVGSSNPAKIEGVKLAFSEYFKEFEIEAVKVESNVANQPVNEQIYIGASNRVKNVRKIVEEKGREADFYVAIELYN